MLQLLVIPYMAIASRLHGWGGFNGCRTLSQVMLTVPYVVAVILGAHNLLFAAITAVLTYLAFTLGHGDGFAHQVRDNTLVSPIAAFIAKIFNIDRNSRLYDHLFMTIKGTLIALPTLIFLPFSIYYVAFAIVSIIAWPTGYWFRNKIWDGDCEVITGIIQAIALIQVI